MITESSRYYGAVLASLVDQLDGELRIRRAFPNAAGFYVVNGQVPVYVKFSTSRRGPWRFTFQVDHCRSCNQLRDTFGRCVVVLICGGDGMVALDLNDLENVLGADLGQQTAVSVRRKRNHMYSVSGPDGELDWKVSRSSLATVFR